MCFLWDEMRAFIQRVQEASVSVDGCELASIGAGLLVYIGITHQDSERDIDFICNKLIHARLFSDLEGKLNLSCLDLRLELLLISQFTLYGELQKGRRPSFSDAAPAEVSSKIFNQLLEHIRNICDLRIEQGKFQSHMKVHSINDGPVSLLIESNNQAWRT